MMVQYEVTATLNFFYVYAIYIQEPNSVSDMNVSRCEH